MSPQAGRGAGDSRGCTGTGIQECCFFHPGFRQGSKSPLQKAFVFPSTLPAAVLASPGLACRSQDEAIPVHTPRSCSTGSRDPLPCQGKQSHPIPLSLPPFPRHWIPAEKAFLDPSRTARLCPPCCHPLLAVSSLAVPWKDIGVAQVTPHWPQPCRALGFSSGVLVQGGSPHRQLGCAFPQHTAQPSWPGIQGAGRDWIAADGRVPAHRAAKRCWVTPEVSPVSAVRAVLPYRNTGSTGMWGCPRGMQPPSLLACGATEGRCQGKKAPRGEGRCPAPLRGHSAAGTGEV